jgi:type VI secretion system protein ImpE
MLNSAQALKDGNLEQALADSQQLVRKDLANVKYRIYLFQLYSVLGQWEKALTQLNVLADMDKETLPMVQTYSVALRCERLRKDIYSGLKTPQIFGEPQQWIALLVQALKLSADQQHKEAQLLRDQAFELAPATAGTINGQAFEWLADADARLGPVIEAIVNGQYYWIPFSKIQSILIDEPADLRDVVWMPVHFVWVNGGDAVGLIPTRYPDSENHQESAIKLARKTEWTKLNDETFIGFGQRLFITNNNDYSLMDVREITFADTSA